MTSLLKKLNYKAQNSVHLINHPREFEQEIDAIKHLVSLEFEMKEMQTIDFILIFAKTKEEINHYFSILQNKLKDDGVLWFAYPKGTSKKYKVEISRDHGWEILGKNEFKPVRAVAIDNDWSALRFRKAAYIKTLTRNEKNSLSDEGKYETQTT